MASVTIVRDSDYMDRLRAYQVILDGKNIGQVRRGETTLFTVSAGQHQLALKIDWCGSAAIEFTAREGEALEFRAKSGLSGKNWFVRGYAALYRGLFDRHSYLLIEKTVPLPQ